MTEYDFSPEAYERYLATQARIANWVDKTEQHRAQFEHAIQPSPPPSGSPPARPSHHSYDSHHGSRSKRSPPPPMHLHGHPQQYQQPRQLFIHPPSPASDSSDDYGDGPGPMPLTSPGVVFPQQQQHPAAYHHLAPMPMMHAPGPMVLPQTYMATPHHKSSSRHHHRSSHSRSRSHHSPGYYSVASPPVSPGYRYAYPQMTARGHPGYMMMQPQPPRAMPYMSPDLTQPPRSAPASVTSFSVPTSPASAQLSNGGVNGSYFPTFSQGSNLYPPQFNSPNRVGAEAWSYGVASPSHSVVSASTGTTGTIAVVIPPPQQQGHHQTHHFTSIPQYQGIHSAMASPTYLPALPSGSSYSNNPLYAPQMHHARAYDFGSGKDTHYLRRSIG
ncbi:hypothetical protein CPC08DRAFT_757546 [Agrocybe pediades]|nr:hypothetical protein CPC08DRAFT_757546 [Agrocybe pediades]